MSEQSAEIDARAEHRVSAGSVRMKALCSPPAARVTFGRCRACPITAEHSHWTDPFPVWPTRVTPPDAGNPEQPPA